MSTLPNQGPRLDQASATDESLLAAHEKLLGKQPDEKARYKLLPLNLLFVFSGLIFFAGTYLNRYSGLFDPRVYNENALPPTGETVVAKIDPLVLGKKQYDAICITCHQANGLGLPGTFPPLAGSEWVTGSNERLIRLVVYGMTGPVKVKDVVYSAAPMPTIGKVANSAYNLSDDKVAAVLTYIRHEWGNTGAPITTEQVAAIRSKEGDRKPYVQEELLKLP
jgi:mono/diheme cytochrome c family protein